MIVFAKSFKTVGVVVSMDKYGTIIVMCQRRDLTNPNLAFSDTNILRTNANNLIVGPMIIDIKKF